MINMKYKTIKLLFIFGAIILIAILTKINFFLLIQNDRTNFLGQAIYGFFQEFIIAMIAGFLGPLVGFIVGCLGNFFGYFSFDSNAMIWTLYSVIADPYSFLKYGIYGLFIGIFWKRYNFLNNTITLKSILLFCVVKIVSDILFLNVITYLLNNVFFIFITIHMVIVNKIIYTIPYFIILLIYSRIKRIKNDNKISQHCT